MEYSRRAESTRRRDIGLGAEMCENDVFAGRENASFPNVESLHARSLIAIISQS